MDVTVYGQFCDNMFTVNIVSKLAKNAFVYLQSLTATLDVYQRCVNTNFYDPCPIHIRENQIHIRMLSV